MPMVSSVRAVTHLTSFIKDEDIKKLSMPRFIERGFLRNCSLLVRSCKCGYEVSRVWTIKSLRNLSSV